jgi:hypothetical protein
MTACPISSGTSLYGRRFPVKACFFLLLTLTKAISAAPDNAIFNVGDKALGGTVFVTNAEGTHGLVAANSDQGKTYMARGADLCSDTTLFDTQGQYYPDWRMPTGTQLLHMYDMRELIGGFRKDRYWAVSGSLLRNFRNGERDYDDVSHDHLIRCIRSF